MTLSTTKRNNRNKLREKEGYYIMIEGSIHQDTTIVNIYISNTGALKYIKQIVTELKGEMNSNAIKVGEFNTLLSTIDRSSRHWKRREFEQHCRPTRTNIHIYNIPSNSRIHTLYKCGQNLR